MKEKFKSLHIIAKLLIGAAALAAVVGIIVLIVLYANGTIRYVKPAKSTEGKYLMCYFIGNEEGEEQIHMSVSEDGVNFSALNNDKPVITQELGTTGARDPYIIKAQDGSYYIVATDMLARNGWTSNHAITIWHSNDLVTWKDETNIDFRSFPGFENCTRAWAPQVIWDPDANQYMLYLALSTPELMDDNPELYYCYTSDFKTFTQPNLLYKRDGLPCIDGDIVYNKANNKYYLYFKFEESQKIAYVTSSSLTGPYEGEPVVVSYDEGVEGSQMYNINGTDSWIMMMDNYWSHKFVALQTDDFEHFTKLKEKSYDYTASPRHGSVVSITNEEYSKLVSAYGFEHEEENRLITPF